MKIALLCDPGCEAFAAAEVQTLIKKEAAPERGYVTLECSVEEMALLNYRSQITHRILAFIAEGAIKEAEDVLEAKEQVLAFEYTPFHPKPTFRVTCERHGEHDFQAREVEEALGALIHEEKKFSVKLEEPAMDLWCKVVDDRFVFGIDLTGRDLGKREYRAFHTRKSLRATIAAASLYAAGFNGEEKLVDPFCIDGVIPIEAALIATKFPVQKYRKEFSFTAMPFAKGDWDTFFAKEDEKKGEKADVTGFTPQVRTLKMARANAKLAGIDKSLMLTKCEVNWLDTKFEKESVDILITVPPASGKNTPLKNVEKLQDDLFYQARYSLTEKGCILLITDKRAEFLNAATRHKFELESEQVVHMGGSKLLFLKFKKKKV